MKNITVAGRLTKDAEIKQAQRDDFLQFSVAVDDFNGKDKSPLFFDVSMFGKRIQTLQQYLTKGTSVAVAGDFGINEYNGKTYLKIRANEVTLQGGGNRSSEPRQQQREEPRPSLREEIGEDLPF
jgi:single-strand DNA-binding protein